MTRSTDGRNPNAGADTLSGTAPTIAEQPTNTVIVAFGTAVFNVAATGTEPLAYQWRRNGVNIPGGTNQTLQFSPEPLGDALFSVVVMNAAGSTISSNATLTVLLPAFITTHPVSRTVFPTSNVTFTVSATSTSPMRYSGASMIRTSRARPAPAISSPTRNRPTKATTSPW